MITAYFDASGRPSSTQPPALFVSGFASTDESWQEFQGAWDALLVEHRIDGPFHATEFFSGNKGFAFFRNNAEARDSFLREAIVRIKRHSMASFSSGVYLHVLREIDATYALQGHERYPYALCGLNVIGKVERWREHPRRDPVRYVFEDGDDHKGELISICRRLEEESRTPLSLSFERMKSVAALQAADLLAWLSSNWTTKVERMVSSGAAAGRIAPPPWLQALADEVGNEHWGMITKKNLQDLCVRRGFEPRGV